MGWLKKQAVAFLKKAPQKTFVSFLHGMLKRPPDPRSKSFLLLFFKKEALSF